MSPPPLIVAFAGPPGAGKSTLIACLRARLPESVAIASDDFPSPWAMPLEALESWAERGENFAELDVWALAEALRALKAGRPVTLPDRGARIEPRSLVFVEAPLGRAHPEVAPLVERLVWIDTPLDVALARNLAVWRGDARPPAGWVDNYVDAYLSVTRRVLVAQRDAVLPEADLVLDGMRSVAALTDEVETWLAR